MSFFYLQSSALVLGWYTSQLIHLKYKYMHRGSCDERHFRDLFTPLSPYVHCVNKNTPFLESNTDIQKVVNSFTPTVYSVSDDHAAKKAERPASTSSAAASDASSNDLGDVLNSIENKLGLAAIENGQHQEGLNLLR